MNANTKAVLLVVAVLILIAVDTVSQLGMVGFLIGIIGVKLK